MKTNQQSQNGAKYDENKSTNKTKTTTLTTRLMTHKKGKQSR